MMRLLCELCILGIDVLSKVYPIEMVLFMDSLIMFTAGHILDMAMAPMRAAELSFLRLRSHKSIRTPVL